MQACIVGHGPSLLESGYGKSIDAHDTVVRIKRSHDLLLKPGIYGSRADIALSSMVIAPQMLKEWDCAEFWFFLDTRTHLMCPQAIRDFKTTTDKTVRIDRELCLEIIQQYRNLRQKPEMDARQQPSESHLTGTPVQLSDEMGHLHPSAGTFAIGYALKYLQPETLRLYGFDNISSGDFNWSVTRGMDWHHYPDHNWDAESLLLAKMAKDNGYKLLPGNPVVTLCK